MTEKLLRLVGPVHVVAGLVVFVSGFFPSSLLAVLERLPAAPGFEWSPFLVAVFGPTVASWGLLFGSLVRQFLDSPGEQSWRAMLFAVLIWAPLDSALCLYYGFRFGAILNVLVFVAVTVLLLAVRSRLD